MRSHSPLAGSVLALSFVLFATPALAQQARMHGSVTDAAGSPVVRAKVLLEPMTEKGAATSGVTNKKGQFMIGFIRPGSYRLSVAAEGMVLSSIRIKALDLDKKVAYEAETRVSADQPPVLSAEDGMTLVCDIALDRAVVVAEEAGTRQVTSEEALAVAIDLVQRGDCEGALARLAPLLENEPRNARGLYLSGYCLAQEGSVEKAQSAVDTLLIVAPEFQGAHLLRGQILSKTGRMEEAEQEIRTEIAAASTPALETEAWVALGSVYRDHGKSEEAVAAFEQVLRRAPERPEIYVELATLHTRAGEPEKAEAVLEAARLAGALDPRALLNVGIAYFNRKEHEHAREAFQHVIEGGAEPSDLGAAWALLGRCQLNDGQVEEAKASFRKSLELDPSGALAQDTRQVLEALERQR